VKIKRIERIRINQYKFTGHHRGGQSSGTNSYEPQLACSHWNSNTTKLQLGPHVFNPHYKLQLVNGSPASSYPKELFKVM